METQLRKDMLAFLTPLLSMQTEKGRRALLLSAGLDAILAQTDLGGPPGVSVPLLVNALELYGTIETGEPALVVFLQEIARQVGQDKQRQIQDFCERLQKGQPVPQQSRISEQQTPAEEQERTITAQRDYFEQVGGNVYTGPVNIYQGTPPPAIRLRSEPRTVSEKDFKEVFELDKNWRPHDYIQNDYDAQGNVVVDHRTGLIWQKSGADEPLTYEDAQKYVEELNRQKFAGDDWRLPTIPELMSLLEPTEKNGDLYIDPIFDSKQRWCWSADRLPESERGSPGAAWRVVFDLGEVSWNYVKRGGYVRCVRSRE